MFGGKQSQQIRHQRHIEDGDDADMEGTPQLPWFAADFLKKIFELTKNCAGVLLKDQTGRREENALSPPLKERDTKARFQVAHLLGDTRLGNSQTVRRATEAASLSDREEVAQVADFQGVLHCGGILWDEIGKMQS